MKKTKVILDVSYVTHLRDCINGRVNEQSVNATLDQLDSIIEKYKRRVAREQMADLDKIPAKLCAIEGLTYDDDDTTD